MVWLEAFRRYFEHSTNGFLKMLTELLNVFWNYRIVVLFRKHIPVQKYARCQKNCLRRIPFSQTQLLECPIGIWACMSSNPVRDSFFRSPTIKTTYLYYHFLSSLCLIRRLTASFVSAQMDSQVCSAKKILTTANPILV